MTDVSSGQYSAGQAPARILVVEDEAVVAMDVEMQLRDMGYEVCGCADNADDAIAHASSERPDLVLMDIVIKGNRDGVETADYISHALNIPVLFLTAYSDDRTVARAARTAPYGYLTKPFQRRELYAGIEVALSKARLERRLRESEQWFAATLRCVGDGVVATDAQGRIRFVNPAAESMLGWRNDEARGHDVNEVVHLEGLGTESHAMSPVHQALASDRVVGMDFGTTLVARNGERRPIDDSAAPIRDEQGRVLGAVIVFRDVHERLQAEERLRQSEQRFRNAFDFAPVGMALVSLDNRFLQVNSALCTLLGVGEAELVGADIGTFSNPEDVQREQPYLYELLAGASASVQFEKRYRRRDDAQVWTLVNVSLLRQNAPDGQPLCFLFQVHDVSERKEAEFRLARLAHYDALTGLANRAWLSEKIESEIVTARRHQARLAVVFMDLDHFKQVNDTLGHEAGDELLKTLAERLRKSVRESDTVARLGGDEFVFLLPEVHGAEDVLLITEKVRAECVRPMQIAGQEVRVGTSMGVSLFPEDAQDSRTLLRYADSALYHAKAEGRNHLQFYRPELTAHMEERMRLGAGLRTALERHEFELHFQPIVSLPDRRPLSAEALIRWNHPERGQLPPDAFVPLAEDAGMIAAIGEWVINEACRQAVSWDGGAGSPGVSVNVSASQFNAGNLVQIVERALEESGLESRRLCIEITEQILLKDSEKNRAAIAALKALGVRISIDDFGTGYSSLSYISHFNPTELKIDRSLVSGVTTDPERAAIVSAALAMGRSLNVEVVMEGVETEAQQAFLEQHGCERAQGFLYSRPCPASEFIASLGRLNA